MKKISIIILGGLLFFGVVYAAVLSTPPSPSGAITPSSISTAGVITSTLATGTAPFTIASTTQVSNLNAATAGTATNQSGGSVAATTISASSTITPSQTAGIVGTTTNNNADAGSVGEVIAGTRAVGSPLSLTSTVTADVTSVSLTAGDWDCNSIANFITAATTSISPGLAVGTSTTSATLGSDNTFSNEQTAAFVPGVATLRKMGPYRRFSVATTTIVYLVVNAGFNVDTLTVHGNLTCRRMR